MVTPKTYPYQGREYSCSMLAFIAHVSPSTMRQRLQTMAVEDAVEFTPTQMKEQRLAKHQVACQKYEYNGQKYSLSGLAKLCNVRRETMIKRLKSRNGDVVAAVEFKPRPKPCNPPKPKTPRPKVPRTSRKFYEYNGGQYSIGELLQFTKNNEAVLYTRINQMGWSVDKALKTPSRAHLMGEKFWYKDELYTRKELAGLAGCAVGAMGRRLQCMSAREAVEMGPSKPRKSSPRQVKAPEA